MIFYTLIAYLVKVVILIEDIYPDKGEVSMISQQRVFLHLQAFQHS